ncbi:homeobox protein not2-like protein [Aphelenchoides avenae]|nr:homeobox protein not2-like protein [Aphelenchus avenae]
MTGRTTAADAPCTSSNVTNRAPHDARRHHGPKSACGKPKRFRTAFTQYQLDALERQFMIQQYLVGQHRVEFAQQLGLNELQVKVWFQNRRIKWRRQQRELALSSTQNWNAVNHTELSNSYQFQIPESQDEIQRK